MRSRPGWRVYFGENLDVELLATDGGLVTAALPDFATARGAHGRSNLVAVENGDEGDSLRELGMLFECGELLNGERADEQGPPSDDMGWLRQFDPASARDSWRRVSLEERAAWVARGARV